MWLVTILLLGAAGCGGEGEITTTLPKEPVHPVKGKVLLADGKPLAEGEITFVPLKQPGRAAAGKLGPDGSFALQTKDLGEGAPEGEYKVRIESPLTTPAAKKGMSRSVVPAGYQDEDGNPLRFAVKAGANELPPIKLVPIARLAGRDDR